MSENNQKTVMDSHKDAQEAQKPLNLVHFVPLCGH
jgi:hypothetical protein